MMVGFGKSMMQSVWMVWERGFGWVLRFRSLHTTHFGICTVMIKRHRGSSILCQDSTLIHDGDMIGELHLNNDTILALIKAEGPDRAALKTARLARRSMMQISEAFEDQPEFREVKALVGITLLHRGLTHGLGFEQQALKYGVFRQMTTAYLRLLLTAMHPDGQRRVARKTEALIPMMLIHTRASLKNRFLSGGRKIG
nr:polysaccharide deacetylase [Paenibacillus agaridevorans]